MRRRVIFIFAISILVAAAAASGGCGNAGGGSGSGTAPAGGSASGGSAAGASASVPLPPAPAPQTPAPIPEPKPEQLSPDAAAAVAEENAYTSFMATESNSILDALSAFYDSLNELNGHENWFTDSGDNDWKQRIKSNLVPLQDESKKIKDYDQTKVPALYKPVHDQYLLVAQNLLDLSDKTASALENSDEATLNEAVTLYFSGVDLMSKASLQLQNQINARAGIAAAPSNPGTTAPSGGAPVVVPSGGGAPAIVPSGSGAPAIVPAG